MNTQNLEEFCGKQKGTVRFFNLSTVCHTNSVHLWCERNDLNSVLTWLNIFHLGKDCKFCSDR